MSSNTQIVIDDRRIERTHGTDWQSQPGKVKLHFELTNLTEEDKKKILAVAQDFRRIDTARVTGELLVVWIDVSTQERQAVHGYVDSTAGNLLRAIERALTDNSDTTEVTTSTSGAGRKTRKKGSYRNGTGRGGRR